MAAVAEDLHDLFQGAAKSGRGSVSADIMRANATAAGLKTAMRVDIFPT